MKKEHPLLPKVLVSVLALLWPLGFALFAVGVDAEQPEQEVRIAIPHLGGVDVLGLRFCPMHESYRDVICDSVGTTGHIEKISWNGDLKSLLGNPIEEASYHFDRTGNLDKVCRRGHTDFQGRSCQAPIGLAQQTSLYDGYNAKLDEIGRITRTSRPGPRGDMTCSYEETAVLGRSICRQGMESYIYEYDRSGRRTAYHRRRIPKEGEAPELAAHLASGFDLDANFEYTNDSHGNWTSIRVTRIFEGKALVDLVERTIKYY